MRLQISGFSASSVVLILLRVLATITLISFAFLTWIGLSLSATFGFYPIPAQRLPLYIFMLLSIIASLGLLLKLQWGRYLALTLSFLLMIESGVQILLHGSGDPPEQMGKLIVSTVFLILLIMSRKL